jgi:hypothetical protein
VLKSNTEQEKLRDHLHLSSNSFSVKSFVETMRRVVAEFAEQHISAH